MEFSKVDGGGQREYWERIRKKNEKIEPFRFDFMKVMSYASNSEGTPGATMKQLTVRNVPEELAQALTEERVRRGESLNKTVLDLLFQALGLTHNRRFDNGLSRLAGQWSEEEFREFEANTALFEQIDEDLWR